MHKSTHTHAQKHTHTRAHTTTTTTTTTTHARSNTGRGIESCGILAGQLSANDSLFTITTLIIPKQQGTSDTVQVGQALVCVCVFLCVCVCVCVCACVCVCVRTACMCMQSAARVALKCILCGAECCQDEGYSCRGSTCVTLTMTHA